MVQGGWGGAWDMGQGTQPLGKCLLAWTFPEPGKLSLGGEFPVVAMVWSQKMQGLLWW